jgi:hypothetical protein
LPAARSQLFFCERQNQQAGASQTYIAAAGHAVAGYYTLVFGQVEYAAAPERLTKGLARHPVPIMLLGRLAVATSWQAVMPCALRVADETGMRLTTPTIRETLPSRRILENQRVYTNPEARSQNGKLRLACKCGVRS